MTRGSIRTEPPYCPGMGKATDNGGSREDRPARTRAWIVAAFNRIVFHRGYQAMSVGEVCRLAGVGRSTFYEHFRDKDQVLHHALRPILTPLANAASGDGDTRSVEAALAHIADQHKQARAMLNGPGRSQVEQALADLILIRLVDRKPVTEEKMRRLESARRAGAQIALIRSWLMEEDARTARIEVVQMLMEGEKQKRSWAEAGVSPSQHR